MKEKYIKRAARVLLGAGLVFAGISHLTFARKDFRAQVPNWVPLKKDDTVIYSGIAEIALGSALAFSQKSTEQTFGKIAAGFFTAVFSGQLSPIHPRPGCIWIKHAGEAVYAVIVSTTFDSLGTEKYALNNKTNGKKDQHMQ